MTIQQFKAAFYDIENDTNNKVASKSLEDIERMFWKRMNVNCAPPCYGADIPGSLFADDEADAWNVNKLDTLLQLTAKNIPGYGFLIFQL